jgi:hypothetical protein
VEAKDYHVLWATDGPSTTSGGIPSSAFVDAIDQGVPWRTIAAKATITNYADKPVRAIHIKVRNSSDRFVVDVPSAGQVLFKHVWQKKDRSEVIFNDGFIDVEDSCYSYVYPKTPNNGSTKSFLGRVSDKNIPVPQDGTWEQVYGEEDQEQEAVMKRLLAACPPLYRDIQVYAESTDQKRVCFLSRGRVFVYDDDKQEVRPAVTEVLKTPINRITAEKAGHEEVFVLWRTGIRDASINATSGPFGKPLRKGSKK